VETALIHKGNYPLSDLQITFEDSLLRDKILADDISNSKYHYKLSDMDTMFKPAIKRLKLIKSFPTGSSIHNYVTMTLSGDHSYYTLNYWTRNRRFTQILSFRFVLNKWTFATMVVDDKDKELYFDINNDFSNKQRWNHPMVTKE